MVYFNVSCVCHSSKKKIFVISNSHNLSLAYTGLMLFIVMIHNIFWYLEKVSQLMPLSHYDHESQESPRIDKFQDSWGSVMPLRPQIPRISKNWQFSGFVVESILVREVPTSFVYIRSEFWSIGNSWQNPGMS